MNRPLRDELVFTDGGHPSSFAQTILEALARLPGAANEWLLESQPDRPVVWLVVRHSDFRMPDQGWKLHISASLATADEALSRVLPALLAEPVAFKVAASAALLAALNDGTGALSQIGKFMTVYPTDDAQAVRLAIGLVGATRGLQGPSIRSDRRLQPQSVVYYRYGAFRGLTMHNATGEISFALRNPSGALEPDVRGLTFQPPAWVTDPFVVAGVASELPAPSTLIGERFLIVGRLYRSVRGGTFIAVDLDSPQTCVLKHSEAGAMPAPRGGDAHDQLRHEAGVLKRLGPDRRFPKVLAVVEQDGDLYMAMSDLGGTTLERHVLAYNARGCTLDCAEVVAWGRELAAMLTTVHAAGLVYRDLKSTNVIVTADGRLGLVDFEQACEQGADGKAPGRGTRGYMSPEHLAGERARVTDDVYGVGALLAYMVTGAEPSQAPRPLAPLDRPLELLNSLIGPGLRAVIIRCLAADPVARFPTIAALDAALMAVQSGADTMERTDRDRAAVGASEDEAAARQRCGRLSYRLGDTICRTVSSVPDGLGRAWVSNHPLGMGIHGRFINTGTAGTMLALAELVSEFGDSRHSEVLANAGRWLSEAPRPGGEPLPGLYVGEAGVAAALLRAGQVLADQALVEAAVTTGRDIARMPHASPDLFNGSAGRVRFNLILWDETHDPEDLLHARDAGEHVLTMMEDAGDGGRCWTIPPGYGGMSGQAYLGYAHGAAGIADALLDLVEVTGDVRLLDAARGASRWLARVAMPALADGSGLCWRTTEGGEPAAAYWCHGAAGIGRFWLHAAALDLVPAAPEFAARAAATTAHGVRWAAPPQCHGLAGAIELLVDAYQATDNPARLNEARALQRLVEAFELEQNGQLVWPSESPDVVSPDYNVGYAGVAAALLRLANPERRPHGLSRQAFRYRGTHAANLLGRSGGQVVDSSD